MKNEHLRRAGVCADVGLRQAGHPVVFGLDADPREAPARQPRTGGSFGFQFFFRGHGEMRDETGRYPIAPGRVIMRDPTREQRVVFDGAERYGCAYLAMPQRVIELLEELAIIDRRVRGWACADPATVLRRHDRCMVLFARRPRPHGAAAWSLVLHWLAVLVARPESSDDPLAVVARLLREDYTGAWSLQDMAEHCGLNYHSLRRRFRQHFGESPNAYRMRARMEEAGHLLAERSIAAVAEHLGYADPLAFAAQFKRTMGDAPGRWRDRMLGL